MANRQSRLPLLIKEPSNFATWIIDARAKLHPQDFWACCQIPIPEGAGQALEKRHIKAADWLTPSISGPIKFKLTETQLNDGYLMLKKLRQLFTPAINYTFYSAY